MEKRRIPKRLGTLLIITTLIITFSLATRANKVEFNLTQEEIDYVKDSKVLKAASIIGGAPLHYIDSGGHVAGIAVGILENIAETTGLQFEYILYDSVEEAYASDSDIFFGLSSQYALADMILSQPYLKSGTVLFVNASLDSNSLEDKRYAGLEGGSIPAGVNKEKVIYYKTREATLNAVDMGQADYGYGNAYSVSYYTLKNGYKNIVTIPRGIETREYCIGLVKEDYILLSIINKAIASMDETAVQTLILDMTSKIDRKITLPMILDLYDLEIFLGSMLIIGLLILGIATNVRAKHHLKIENQRYKILSHISNEYLYEYNFKSDRLTLSESLSHIFLNRQDLDLFKARLKEDLIKQNFKEIIPRLDLPLSKSERRIFKGINSKIYDDRNNIYSVIGKLVDVTEETAEKDALITKAQVDGLTGLYNASTTKELILEKIEARDNLQKDVFMIIDGDRFKEINDTFGHLEGNRVLKKIAQAMRLTFRQTDIIGRVGGDEFAVYMKEADSEELIESKFKQLKQHIKKLYPDYNVSFSVGASFLKDEDTYENMFRRADRALYTAKDKGGDQLIIYGKGK